MTLSPYLATYFGIGLVLAHLLTLNGREVRDAFGKHARSKQRSWAICAIFVLLAVTLWPVWIVQAAVRAVRR